MVEFGQKRLYSGKSGSIPEKVVLFRQKWNYSGKWLYLGNVVVFAKKLLSSGNSGCL